MIIYSSVVIVEKQMSTYKEMFNEGNILTVYKYILAISDFVSSYIRFWIFD